MPLAARGKKSRVHGVWRVAGAKVTTLCRGAAKRYPTHVGPWTPQNFLLIEIVIILGYNRELWEKKRK